jgi:hypothetical protein
MRWQFSHRADNRARQLADRHYNRQKPGTPQFVPPGRCLVLLSDDAKAFWVTSWPFAQYVKHAWAGAWVCSAFRNEGDGTASDLIREAVAATRFYYGDAPPEGMITFVDPRKVKPTVRRGVEFWGYSYWKAGFKAVGKSKGGLWCFHMAPGDMPAPVEPKPFTGAGEGPRMRAA